MNHRHQLVLLPPNRVWRSYTGGATLERLAGAPVPADSHLAEDWIASTTPAVNPGCEHLREGVSPVIVGWEAHDFRALLEHDPEYFLGATHRARHGDELMLLVKFLDSATRLHFQAHPSRDFARAHLNARCGKTEAYHILGVRDDVIDPYLYIGFQRPPSPARLREMIEQQDITGLEACFDKVRVAVGETYLVPAGVPHALGPGLFLVEIQEPSDLVARLEFKRDGCLLPEPARFMGRDLDFALSFLDGAAYPLHHGLSAFRCGVSDRHRLGPGAVRETLIGPERCDCFRVCRTRLDQPVKVTPRECAVVIVAAGTLRVRVAGRLHTLRRYEKFFLPAGIGTIEYLPDPGTELLECCPPV